jgi:DNA integrity scanning protein DisA with diadenylate cyclase activity
VYNSFTRFLKTHKYSIWDFLEPLLVLPIVYSIINFFQGVSAETVLTAAIAFLIYLPIILAVFRWRRK